MFNRNELRFERRSILTAAQLRAIEKFPREFLRLTFADFGDGILSGLDFVTRNDEIFLTAGVVKLGEKFFLADEMNLSTLIDGCDEGKRYRLVLGTPQRTATEGVINEKISLEVKPLDETSDGADFGRFKAGIVKLPDINAENLYNEFTRSSRLNLLHVPQAVRGGTTFHPTIFRAILSRLQHKENPSPADVALMLRLADGEPLSLPALKIFVECKSVKWRDASPEEIFKSVIDAVDAVQETVLPAQIHKPEKVSRPKSTPDVIII